MTVTFESIYLHIDTL